MAQLPVTSDSDEAVTPWDARETLLDVGRIAARRLGRWDDALSWNAEILASLNNRRAPATDIALARLHDHAPLLRLGRTSEALRVLLDCRQVFEDTRDIKKLGMVLSGLADAEDDLGHGDAAIQLERDALRYSYLAGSLADIAVSYNNLGIYLRKHARQGAPALGCHLAAALIRVFTDSRATRTFTSRLANSILGAAADLRELGSSAVPPADIADLCRLVGDIPGTDLPGLIARLSPNTETAEQTLSDLVSQAQAKAAQPPTAMPP
jgi:tetratricopeptide (TPR) repeat protein